MRLAISRSCVRFLKVATNDCGSFYVCNLVSSAVVVANLRRWEKQLQLDSSKLLLWSESKRLPSYFRNPKVFVKFCNNVKIFPDLSKSLI